MHYPPRRIHIFGIMLAVVLGLALVALPNAQPVRAASPSTTALTSAPNPSVSGQSVTLTATVAAVLPGAGTPTGTVSFFDGGALLGTGTLAGGVATFSTSALAVGSHSLTAVYGGDASFTGSTSPVVTQTVNKAATTTTVQSCTPAQPVVGQAFTCLATVAAVSPGAGTPTGTVTFRADNSVTGTVIGTCTLNQGSPDQCTSSPAFAGLAVGAHTIYAIYSGDLQFLGSTSAAFPLNVGKASTTTTLSGSPNPAGIGQSVTYTAVVTVNPPGVGTPTGTVGFTDNGVTIPGCGAVSLQVVNGHAQATCTTSYPFANTGVHQIVATYSGDTAFLSSTSNTFVETVTPCTVTGALAVGNQRLGVAFSSKPAFSIHYLTFQSGALTFTVRNPVITLCVGAGTSNATVTITGTISSVKGGMGDRVTATLTQVNGAPGTATVTDLTASKTYTLAPPFSGTSRLTFSAA